MENKIICLCGSLRFKKEFEDAELQLTAQGYACLLPCLMFMDIERKNKYPNLKNLVDNIHRKKIEIADEIFIVNPGNYIGKSTSKELEYAIMLNKPIYYYSTGDKFFYSKNLMEIENEIKSK